jgi:predicted transcriptional regulator
MNINKKYFVHSIQKKMNKRKQREDTLQKAKHDIINQHYDIIDDIQYETPYESQWNQTKIVVGIWNEKEKKVEFTDNLLKKLDKEIQILFNPVE